MSFASRINNRGRKPPPERERVNRMKIYNKWLVLGRVNEKSQIITSFNTKKDAEYALNMIMTKKNDNYWEDTSGNGFFIEFNKREYRR